MKRPYAAAIVFVLAGFLAAQDRPATIGIIEFQGGSGISAIDAKTVTEVFRSELVTTGTFTVLERGKMDEILKEQQFQQTGCTSTECAVKLGKLLNMRKMLYGTMSKLGSRYYFVVTIVDIETSKVEKSVNDSMEGLDDLSKVVKRLIEQIIGGKRLIKAGESPFLKVHGMIKTDLFNNAEGIKKEAPYITDAEKMQLVNLYKKDFWGSLYYNIIPGFGLGSFIQGDWVGGLTGALLDGIGWTLVVLGTSQSGDSTLISSDRGVAGGLTGAGLAVVAGSAIVMAVWPIIYTATYNDMLNRSLGVKLAFDLDIDAGTRMAFGMHEHYAAAMVRWRY